MNDFPNEVLDVGIKAYQELSKGESFHHYNYEGMTLGKELWCSKRSRVKSEANCYADGISQAVAQRIGGEEPRSTWQGQWFICTKAVAEICPCREWKKVIRSPFKWITCPYCGQGRHRKRSAYAYCKGEHDFKELLEKRLSDGLPNWQPEGTTLDYLSEFNDLQDIFNVRRRLWVIIQERILIRDNHTCQDCGVSLREWEKNRETLLGESHSMEEWDAHIGIKPMLEVHHIIPRIKGGSDHPANLKTVCKNCHAKYTGELASELAEERRCVKLTNGISIEDFSGLSIPDAETGKPRSQE